MSEQLQGLHASDACVSEYHGVIGDGEKCMKCCWTGDARGPQQTSITLPGTSKVWQINIWLMQLVRLVSIQSSRHNFKAGRVQN